MQTVMSAFLDSARPSLVPQESADGTAGYTLLRDSYSNPQLLSPSGALEAVIRGMAAQRHQVCSAGRQFLP